MNYILTVSVLWELCCSVYIGTFDSCDSAQAYYDARLRDSYAGMSCLHEDYVLLPEDHAHVYPQ
jgi:hypothetical protein